MALEQGLWKHIHSTDSRLEGPLQGCLWARNTTPIFQDKRELTQQEKDDMQKFIRDVMKEKAGRSN